MKRNLKVVLGLAVVLFTFTLMFSTLSPATFATETVTNAQMLDMCSRADGFMDLYQRVPQIVYTDGDQTNSVTAAEFMYMMARWIRYYDDHDAVPSTVSIIRNTNGPTSPTGEESGTIQQADILAKGQSCADFIDSNSRVPNCFTVGSTQYTPEALFWVFARTINFYQDNGRLPNYATVLSTEAPQSWGGGDTPTPTPTHTPTPNPYPWSKTISVAFTSQPDGYTCGPTSLRMCMGYYGTWYGVTTIGNYMASIGDSPWYDGVAESTIRSAAIHYGFSGAHISSGLTNLKTCIQNNRPVICHIKTVGGGNPKYYPSNSPAYQGSYGHYVVCVGLHANSSGGVEYYVLNDPARNQYTKYTGSSFYSCWGTKSYHYVNIHS